MSVFLTGVFDSQNAAQLKQVLNDAVNQWQQDWFTNLKFEFDCCFNEQLFAALPMSEEQLQTTHDTGVSIYTDGQTQQLSILQSMFQCDDKTLDALLAELDIKPIEKLYDDLRHRLLSALGASDLSKRPMQQAVARLKLVFDGGVLSVFLDAQVFEAWWQIQNRDKSKPKIQPLKQCVSHGELPLNITIKSEAINFFDVMCLKKGDVVVLKQEIEKPVSVNINHVDNIASGYLVERDNHKAIIFLES